MELLPQRLLDLSRSLAQQPLSDLEGSPLERRPLAAVGLLLPQLFQLEPLHLGVPVDACKGQRSDHERKGQARSLTDEISVVELDEVDVPTEGEDLDEEARALDHGEAADSLDEASFSR